MGRGAVAAGVAAALACCGGAAVPGPSARVFVTPSLHEARVALDPSVCQSEAAAAGLGGQWVAWVASAGSFDSAELTADRVQGAGPWVDLRGRVVFPSWSDLLWQPRAPLQVGPRGEDVPPLQPVWTGTFPGGRRSRGLCVDRALLRVWGSASPRDRGDVGVTGAAGYDWTYAGEIPCSERAHLYCFEQM